MTPPLYVDWGDWELYNVILVDDEPPDDGGDDWMADAYLDDLSLDEAATLAHEIEEGRIE